MALTFKQEAFAQAVVSGMNLSDAYRASYDATRMKATSINRQAKALFDDPKIAARVSALRRPVISKLQYGLEEAMLEAADAFKVAKAREQGGAMVAAVQLRAKLNGLLVDKAEIRTGVLDALPHDDLKALQDALTGLRATGETDARDTVRTTH